MNAIYTWDANLYLRGAIVFAIAFAVVVWALLDIVILPLMRGKHKGKPWYSLLLTVVLPAMICLVLGCVIVKTEVTAITMLTNWESGVHLVAEGTVTDFEMEEDTDRGDSEPYFRCSFTLDGVFFPKSTSRYTQAQMDALTQAERIRITYLMEDGKPLPCIIEAFGESD